MKIYRWLTFGAAIVITVLEAWLFTGASATAAQLDTSRAVETLTAASGGTR